MRSASRARRPHHAGVGCGGEERNHRRDHRLVPMHGDRALSAPARFVHVRYRSVLTGLRQRLPCRRARRTELDQGRETGSLQVVLVDHTLARGRSPVAEAILGWASASMRWPDNCSVSKKRNEKPVRGVDDLVEPVRCPSR